MFDLLAGTHVRLHTVQYNENLATISDCYYGTPCEAMAIFQANRHCVVDPNRVYAGQRLVIPHIPYPKREHHRAVYV